MLIGVFFCLWLGFHYLFPLFLPFLLGGLLALSAEPAVKFLSQKLRLPRPAAAVAGVFGSLAMLVLILFLLGALTLRQAAGLTDLLPKLTELLRSGLAETETRLLDLSKKLPGSVSGVFRDAVVRLFSDGSSLLSAGAGKLWNLATGILGRVPGGAIGFGTGILSAFLISARLPKIRRILADLFPGLSSLRPLLRGIWTTVKAWFQAQMKLIVITFSILCSGFFLLKVPMAPLAAAGVALVDAVPMLGTGTILIPWAVVRLLAGDRLQALGLIVIYGCAAMTRSLLEPRFLGQKLGLDPLVTLIAMYLGYRLGGIPGMIFSPMAAVLALRIAEKLPLRRNMRTSGSRKFSENP